MKTVITVQNLKCGGCAHTITTKLSTVENISEVHVAVDESEISFNYKNESDLLHVKQKLKDLGYPSIEDKNTLTAKSKSFISCAKGKLSN